MTAVKETVGTRKGSGAAGTLLRGWRTRRRLTQLDLSVAADVSARHLSFIETGRAKPTAEMLLHLSERLDVPLRERNALLVAGGYAPAYPEHQLTDVPMSAVSEAVNQILTAHPYPALVIDRSWDLVAANDAVYPLLEGSAPELLEPPVNVLRLSLHPEGLAPRILNLGQWRAHLLERLEREVASTADEELVSLLEELRGYPAGEPPDPADEPGEALVVPLRLRLGDAVLSMFSMTTVFGTPRDVTLSELAIESFYPADEETTRLLGG